MQGILIYDDKVDIVNIGDSKGVVTIAIAVSMISFNAALGDYCAISDKERTSWAFLELANYSNKGFETKAETLPGDGKITTLDFHPDGLLLTTGHESGVLNIWDIRSSKLIKKLSPFKEDPIKSVSFSNLGYYFACASTKSNTVKLFDIRKQFAETAITWESEKSDEAA